MAGADNAGNFVMRENIAILGLRIKRTPYDAHRSRGVRGLRPGFACAF
jgi:hypothetical protein